MNEIFVREIPLPPGIHGATKQDPDGNYNVYLRKQDPDERKKKAYDHEIVHIESGHLWDDSKSVAEKEAEAWNG